MLAARQGERDRAIERFHAVLEQDPDHEEALLWLAALAEDPEHSLTYLRRVLDTNPESARARSGLTWAEDRVRTLSGPSTPPPQPDWGGTVDLLPLDPERTRWRLPALAGLLVGVALVGAIAWWASSMYPLGPLSRSQGTQTKTMVPTFPSPTAAPPRPATTSPPTRLASPLPAAADTEPGGKVVLTPTSWPPTAYPVILTVTATLSSAPATAISAEEPHALLPTAPPATVSSVQKPIPTVTLTSVPIVATLWPTPGPTTDPHTTPEPTPLVHAAIETHSACHQAERTRDLEARPVSRGNPSDTGHTRVQTGPPSRTAATLLPVCKRPRPYGLKA